MARSSCSKSSGNDLCLCGSGKRFQARLRAQRPL
ncbi:SEC-C metal-binding domain-containing protein [Citromicrobium sp. WPS32]